MSNQDINAVTFELKPLAYHENLRSFLKQEESEVWDWYASHKVRDEQAEAASHRCQ